MSEFEIYKGMVKKMKDDGIKEILDKIQKCKDYDDEVLLIKQYGATLLLDYITNLQQENEQLRTQVNTYENPDDLTLFYMWLDEKAKDKMKQLQQENERLKETNVYCNRTDCVGRIKDSRKYDSVYQEKEDYKSRCEKAVEYNQQIIKDTKDFYRPTEDIIYSGDTLIDIAEQNINILNGRSDE